MEKYLLVRLVMFKGKMFLKKLVFLVWPMEIDISLLCDPIVYDLSR